VAKLALNKSGLQKEREHLRLYQRLLPSLDLKRRQLTLELTRAREQMAQIQGEVQDFAFKTAQQLPMLANREIDLSGIMQIQSIQMAEQNVVGVRLPVLENIIFQIQEYSRLAKPPWVDFALAKLQMFAEINIKLQVAAERVRLLELAERRITQRVNLFDKILIPTTKKNIQKIQIFLGDAEREAVVRSKLTKARRRQAQEEAAAERDRP
jgi:V/A-type H+-transporting ATPase subunit D